MAKLETLKVQRSVITTEEVPQMLIYNEDQNILVQLPLGEPFEALFKGNLKMYVTAKVYITPLLRTTFENVTRIPDQDW